MANRTTSPVRLAIPLPAITPDEEAYQDELAYRQAAERTIRQIRLRALRIHAARQRLQLHHGDHNHAA